MKVIQFNYQQHCLVPESEIASYQTQLESEIKRAGQALTQGYNTPYAAINLANDAAMLEIINNVVEQKMALKPTVLVVIGIGGSNLGAMAVHGAVNGKFYNESPQGLKVYWADTVDADYIQHILAVVTSQLAQGNNILLNVVSKSGATTETAANFQLLVAVLQQYKKDAYRECVVATTDKDSVLWRLAQAEHFACLEIPAQVGGRFSVLSAAGLFPLGMLGVDISQLLAGAASVMPLCTDNNLVDNPAAMSAVILAYHYGRGKNIHDTFLFSNELESVGKWYRQLMGESIGKTNNAQELVGITPTVSLGSTDLHSVGQLYLGGPQDKMTSFIMVGKTQQDFLVPHNAAFATLVQDLQGHTLHDIMQAIAQGVQAAYTKRGLPFVSFILPEKSAYYIGQLLQYKMLEIIYLGYLLGVNPFDQPQVELYKKETRDILESL